MVSWGQILKAWEKGDLLEIEELATLNTRVFWESSPFETRRSPYNHRVIVSKTLNRKHNQNFKKFLRNLKHAKSRNSGAVAFWNLDGDTRLVIPTPRQEKNYLSIVDFMQNASLNQQKNFWKLAANEILRLKQPGTPLWVSTHGLGVPYFHLRISRTPKYYKTTAFKKTRTYT